jgi:hypothetical protein
VAHLRKKKAQEEISSLKDKPDINSNYKFKQPRVPLTERKVRENNFDEEMEHKRTTEPSRFNNELQECTFNP